MSGASEGNRSATRTGFFERFGDYSWQFEFFDPARWRPAAVIRRTRQWISASRRRSWIVWTTVVVFALVVLPGALGAVAMAQSSTEHSDGSSTISALSWMNVRDSSGVPLTNYNFVTDHGGLLNPGNTAISLVISLEFAGWMVLVTTAIWLIGYALSFAWLDLFSKALDSVAQTLSRQIATPILLIVAATIGAFFVAWFIVRGFHSKATMQVVTMLLVAVMGPIYLAEPLADVLSSDGLLAQGRNVGLSVAAGLNGNSNPNVSQLIPQTQREMADNFARRPLQVWNYGYVIDSYSSCKRGWTSGMMAGNDDAVRSGIDKCDNGYAAWSTRHPTVGQIGSGLILLLSAAVLLLFAVYLALRVIKAGLDTIYHGIMAIFGFAAGGFIYGPTQTFLVRNVIDGFLAAARMAAFTIFLGVYVLFLGNLFKQAGDQVMPIFIIGAIVEVVAIAQLRKLNEGLSRGNEWVANRVALTMQGAAARGGGGGGGTALGMGNVHAGHSMRGMGVLSTLGAVSTIGNSPVTEWMWGRTRSPLRPFSRTERASTRAQWGVWTSPDFGGPTGAYAQSYQNRRLFAVAARDAAIRYGDGIDTVRGAAAALQGIVDVGGGLSDSWGAMVGAGFTDEGIMYRAIRSLGIIKENAEDETLQDKHLGTVVAAVHRAQSSANRLLDGTTDAPRVAADFATLQTAAVRFRRANAGGVTLDGGAPRGQQRSYVEDYLAAPTRQKILALQSIANGEQLTAANTPDAIRTRLAGVDQQGAARMMRWIGNDHALRVGNAVENFMVNPQDPQAIREVRRAVSHATDTDMWSSNSHRTPWNAPQPPGTNAPNPNWGAVFGNFNDVLGT